MKLVLAAAILAVATSASATTVIKNIVDNDTGLLIGQSWTDEESGATDYVYVDNNDTQLFVHNIEAHKENVETKKTVGNGVVERSNKMKVTAGSIAKVKAKIAQYNAAQ